MNLKRLQSGIIQAILFVLLQCNQNDSRVLVSYDKTIRIWKVFDGRDIALRKELDRNITQEWQD
ncbi:MAG: hypothetical protein IPH22_16475 [Nitrosomonas sp.]|nr:hypothetical protein [Nitrosomonas sp.]